MTSKLSLLVGLAAAALAACSEPQAPPSRDPAVVSRPDAPAVQPQDKPAGSPTAGSPTAGSPAAGGPTAGNPAAKPPVVDAATMRERVMTLLGGIEHIPSREEFNRAGSDEQVVAALDSLARDSATKTRLRAGAAGALGLYPRPDARKSLETLVNDPTLDEVIRRPSIRAYATAFGPDALPLVTKMLDHQDRNTREAAVRALADIGSPAARQALEARSKVEPDAALRKVSQETLARWK